MAHLQQQQQQQQLADTSKVPRSTIQTHPAPVAIMIPGAQPQLPPNAVVPLQSPDQSSANDPQPNNVSDTGSLA